MISCLKGIPLLHKLTAFNRYICMPLDDLPRQNEDAVRDPNVHLPQRRDIAL